VTTVDPSTYFSDVIGFACMLFMALFIKAMLVRYVAVYLLLTTNEA
jgi:hypothetical protein